MSVYVCSVYSVLIGQKTLSDPLELELKLVVSLHVGAGGQTGFLWKSNQCS